MIEHERSSGNVFADLGIAQPEEHKLKAQIVQQISAEIRSRKLSQSAAAELMGVPQPKLSNILRGRFRGVSRDKLTDCLCALGYGVTIRFEHAPPPEKAGHVEIEFA